MSINCTELWILDFLRDKKSQKVTFLEYFIWTSLDPNTSVHIHEMGHQHPFSFRVLLDPSLFILLTFYTYLFCVAVQAKANQVDVYADEATRLQACFSNLTRQNTNLVKNTTILERQVKALEKMLKECCSKNNENEKKIKVLEQENSRLKISTQSTNSR